VPRVYPQRVLDAIGDELYAELEEFELDEETAINTIEDKERKEEDTKAEKAEIDDQRSLSVPAGVTFDPVAHLDNLPPIHRGTCKDGLDNLPPAPLFQGRQWPFL